jgi:PilZ domain
MRTKFESRVKIVHPVHGEEILRTGDVSDGGIYVRAGKIVMQLGETVTVQIQDIPGPAPILTMKVTRCDSHGYGLKFADWDNAEHPES